MGSSLGVFVTGGNKPYLSLCRSFVGKTPNTIGQPDKMSGDVSSCCPDKVGSSGFALYGASEKLVCVDVGHKGRSVGRCPCASLRSWSFPHPYLYYYYCWACRGWQCPDTSDMDPILPERSEIRYLRKHYISR